MSTSLITAYQNASAKKSVLHTVESVTYDPSGDTVITDDTLKTGINTYAEVVFLNGSRMSVAPQSELILTSMSENPLNADTRVEIISGSVFLEMNPGGSLNIELVTNTTVATIRKGKFGVLASGFFWVDEGEIEVMAVKSGQFTRLHSGMFAQISSEGTDILAGQLDSRDRNQLNNRMGLLAHERQELRFIHSLEKDPR